MRRLLCAVTCALIVGACSSDEPPPATAGRGTTTTTLAPPGEIRLGVKSFDVETVEPARRGDGGRDAAMNGVLATLQTYLDGATIGPLRSGGTAGDIAGLFSGRAAPRATAAPDRSALYDEGLPQVESLRPEAAEIALTGLVDSEGTMAVVVARYTVKINGITSGTPIVVQRDAEFVLVPEGGGWKIDAYDVRASRTTPSGTTETTAVNQ